MNYWIEMDLSVKHKMLREAVEPGYLKKDFVEDCIREEIEYNKKHRRSKNVKSKNHNAPNPKHELAASANLRTG